MAKAPAAPVRPIIVKKIYAAPHGGHHGGAWKVAYADFVTAMMAFFLLMWLLGATNEKQRKALADYFAPTLVKVKEGSAGSNGLFGGDSLVSVDKYPHRAGQTGNKTITIPRGAKGGAKEGVGIAKDRAQFEKIKEAMVKAIKANKETKRFTKNFSFTETDEGLRIDMVDQADFTMFISATSRLTPDAVTLLGEVGNVLREQPNGIIIRGHTDAMPYSSRAGTNNWSLSSARAEATRAFLSRQGVELRRFVRIEGVADREPYYPEDRLDPRNRRMSITLGWRS
jgi:chemotaxis protein MotB